jgi:PKD repeat protein
MRGIPWRSALLLALALPATASADRFCVQTASCSGGTAEPTLAAALTAAAGTAGRDRIDIGPVTLSPVTDSDAAGNAVDIVGSGRSATTLNGPTTGGAVTLTIAEPSSTVSNLTINAGNGFTNHALHLAGTVEHADVGVVGTNTSQRGIDVMGGPSFVRDVRVNMPANADAIRTEMGTTTTMEDVTSAGETAIETFGDATVRRAILSAPFALYPRIGTMHAEDVVAATTSDSGRPLIVEAGFADTTFTGRHLTLIDFGSHANTAGVEVFASSGLTATATLSDTITRGFTHDLLRHSPSGGTANLTVDYSDFNPATVTSTDAGSLNLGTHNLDVDPLYVNAPAGNWALQGGSPAIDAGDPAPLGSTESSTDANGQPRLVDGGGDCVVRRDMGAFEFQPGPRAPRAAATAPATAERAAPVTFDGSGSCDPDLDTLAYAWSFDDGATAVGQTVQHAFARIGVHRATLTVTDATGRSTTATANVTVADHVRPAIRGASASPSVFAVGPGATPLTSARKARKGTTFRYTLTEDAKVTIRIQRKAGKRFKPAGKTLRRSGHAGSNRLRFSGRLKRKALRAGRYRALFVAVDPAGNKSKTRKVTFRIVRR